MSHLAREACALRFEEHEFVEFFGIVSPLDEDACVEEPIVTSRLRDCTHSRVVVRGANRCLEIGRPEQATSEPAPPLTWGVRIFVEPHFRVEFIHEVA
jgi:hypothetical protein